MFERSKQLTIRIAVEELAMLKMMADREGISVSDWIRMRARKEYWELYGDKKPPRPKKLAPS
jgi:predicted DNA binding CopG/RHH family protein